MVNNSPREQPSAAKWNLLGSNDASFNDGSGIGAGAIKPVNLATGQSASTWAWQSWTPTWTVLGIGNGSQSSAYIQIGKTIFGRVNVLFGTTSSMGVGVPTFTLPVTGAAALSQLTYFGNVRFHTTKNAAGVLRYGDTTHGHLLAFDATSGDLVEVALAPGTPGTWGTGSTLDGTFLYEAA